MKEILREKYIECINYSQDIFSSEELTDDLSFVEDLFFDSLDQVELIIEIEKKFNIQIPDNEAEKIDTIGKGFKLILKLCKNII